MAAELRAGVGAAPGPLDVVVPLPAEHPTGHGAMRLALRVDGDVIVAAQPEVGYVHRGAEKLFEVRDYRQLLMLADRHDWLAAFTSELGIALAAESALGIVVPERAVWLRTLAAELTRIASHLAFLGPFPTEAGTLTDVRADREAVLRLFESAWGSRIHVMANRIGGLGVDVPAGWPEEARVAVAAVRGRVPAWRELVADGSSAMSPLLGVGRLTRDDAAAYGVSGPLARASGLDVDLRRDDPAPGYAELGELVRVVTRQAGDVPARLQVLVDEIEVACDLADACLDRLAAATGPVDVRLPKVVRLPEGDHHAAVEGPSGTSGYWIVSRGEKTPWRVKMRTASFNNVAALPALLPGTPVAHLAPVLASLFCVVGDVDK